MADDRPNILLITSDQQHWSAMGALNPDLQTPALDRLCAEGARFDRAYCANPMCSPSRSSIITGLYPSVHGCWSIGVKLPEDVPTVAGLLTARGYATALFGKAHFQPLASFPGSESLECQPVLRDLDFWRRFHGPWYGFQHVEVARNHGDESHAGQHYAVWLEDNGVADWRSYFRSPPGQENRHRTPRRWSWDLPQQYHYSAWTAERTIAWLRGKIAAGQPFFAWASFQDPHPPYLVSAPWDTLYDPSLMRPGHAVPGEHARNPVHFQLTQDARPDFSRWREGFGVTGLHSHLQSEDELRHDMAVYFGMISLMDHHIGRILDSLDALGVSDRTMVVFTTDHGHFLGQHGLIRKGPFHYEDMIRIPFLVRYPGVVPRHHTTDSLVSLVDLAPTFLRVAGVPVPGWMQGVDQIPALSGERSVREHVLVENRCLPTRLNLRTYVTARHKLTLYANGDSGELFDLEHDPAEVHNLWDDPGLAALRMTLIQQMMQATMRIEPTRMPRVSGA